MSRQQPDCYFAIPCSHPAAEDGVFLCEPSYYNSEHMRDGFEFLLVDTKKVIAELQATNPDALRHADHKFSGDTAEQWLKSTSLDYPRDMGHWTYGQGRPLAMSSGQSALIRLVQEIDLPCFPIAIQKAMGWEAIDELRGKIGYKGADLMTYQRVRPSMGERGVTPRGLDCE